MADDYRQRCADAAMTAWSKHAVLCEHSQIIPVGSLVDAVLAVRDQDAETLRSDNEDLRKRAAVAEAEVARLRALLDGQEVTDDEDDDEPGYETVTAHLGEMLPTRCGNCGSNQLLTATVHGLTASGSRVMGGIAVCHGCGWAPYGDAVLEARADLDLAMNHAGDPQRIAEYPAAVQRIRDAIEGARRG